MTASARESARLEEPGELEGGDLHVAVDEQVQTRRSGFDRLYRFAPVGDLLVVAAVLALWRLPETTTVALASAAVVGALLWDNSLPPVGAKPIDVAARSAGRMALSLLVALPVALVDGATGPALGAGALVVGSVFVFRHLVATATRRAPAGARRVAIVGTGPLGSEIAEYLVENEHGSLEAVGMIDRQVRAEPPLPVLGRPEDLERIVADHDIDVVIVAYGAFAECDLVRSLRRCEERQVEVVVLPRFFELSLDNLRDELWGYPLTRLQGPVEKRSSWRMKRVFDLVGSALLLVLTLPIMGALALAVRLSSPGPILFKQERVGHRGRIFQMYKFRSMIPNDDSDTTWSVDSDDDRVTPVGRFIRATHLDELPQLFNVLRGDMSLVGPRPERPHFVKLFSGKFEHYEERHRVPVGMTGWSQVNGLWGDTSVEARARLDNRYIESWSLRRDVLILVKTIPTLFRGHS